MDLAGVGFIGATPKSGKTLLALELVVAVASGEPYLGRFAVHKRGPVLVCAAEDDAGAIRRRVAHIAGAPQRLKLESGAELLLPVTLDDCLHIDLEPDRRDRKAQPLERVIGDFHGADQDEAVLQAQLPRLLGALRKPRSG